MITNKEVAISALIGGVIALIINKIYSRYSYARKLNSIRLALLDYCSKIGVQKSYRYLQNMDSMKECIDLYGNDGIEPKDTSVDDMPVYNSQIFKSIATGELRSVAYDTYNFIRILDISSATDYHREHMPYDLFVKFHNDVSECIEKAEIPFEKTSVFINNSPQIKDLKCITINKMEMIAKRGETTSAQYEKLVDHLGGSSLKWVIKYIIKQ